MTEARHTSGATLAAPPPEVDISIYSTQHLMFVTEKFLGELKTYGHTDVHREVCGLITGEIRDEAIWIPKEFHPIKNVSEDNLGLNDYMMDPNESMKVLLDTQIMPGEAKTDLVAVFHTHPFSTPYPSFIDIDTAAYNVVYIIYSVLLGKFSFQVWNGEWFTPISVEVME